MKRLLLFACLFIATSLYSQYKDGEYLGSAIGYEGTIKVKTTVKNGKISKIEILKQNESLALDSFEKVPKRIIESQKLEVDTVTNATITSKAIIEAVKDSLKKEKSQKKSQNTKSLKKAVKLNKPTLTSGKKLMYALSKRSTSRSFSTKELSKQILSNLLWASSGINRKDVKKLTAPTAMNWQEIDVYVALKDGLYLYNRANHSLDLILSKDIREFTGKQDFTQVAPVNLIYVADYSKMKGADEKSQIFYSATDTGFISQNVYLFCAANDLSTVVLGWVDKPNLRKIMKLKKSQKIMLTQPVGYKK